MHYVPLLEFDQCFIEAIRQADCRICLDDFGSGFSTFIYSKYLNVEILKIDDIFIYGLLNNHEDQVVARAITNIARGLEKSLVAESLIALKHCNYCRILVCNTHKIII